MFQQDDLIFYGSAGVCRVEAIGHPPASYPVNGDRLYYKLKPLYDNGEIFTPVDTKVYMRPLVTRAEAENLLRCASTVTADEFHSPKRMEMMDHFREKLNSHDPAELLCLIKTLHERARQNVEMGRNPSAMEQDCRKRAEGLLFGELAIALDTSVDEVGAQVTERIEDSQPLAKEA